LWTGTPPPGIKVGSLGKGAEGSAPKVKKEKRQIKGQTPRGQKFLTKSTLGDNRGAKGDSAGKKGNPVGSKRKQRKS